MPKTKGDRSESHTERWEHNTNDFVRGTVATVVGHQEPGLVFSALLTIAKNKQEMKTQSTATPATFIRMLPLLPTTNIGQRRTVHDKLCTIVSVSGQLIVRGAFLATPPNRASARQVHLSWPTFHTCQRGTVLAASTNWSKERLQKSEVRRAMREWRRWRRCLWFSSPSAPFFWHLRAVSLANFVTHTYTAHLTALHWCINPFMKCGNASMAAMIDPQ